VHNNTAFYVVGYLGCVGLLIPASFSLRSCCNVT